ncbi:MAG: caspase family protein [Sphingobacteriaceae bacterium]|nr:caspase family protein [Sphingobacteriaceae bacterium]
MGKRYSIAVGINDYVDCKNLKFCVKDAKDITDVFTRICSVGEEDWRIIKSDDKEPNSDPWKTFCDTVDKLKIEFTAKEDDLFFYFSGHGIKADETTVVFKNKDIRISEIIQKLEELSPKTKLIFFDSCYSGIGAEETQKSAQLFSSVSKETAGTFIICACAENETAKESRNKNGRFTHFMINILRDLKNYNEDQYLDINSLFSKINTFFKLNPDFKQSPFQQIKSIGTYPLANCFNQDEFYVRYDIDDPETFDWDILVNSLNTYLKTKEDVLGEFQRYIREHCQNTKSLEKGNAAVQSVEISRNKVVLIDNGKYFNLFEPNVGSRQGGGIQTAQHFQNTCAVFFSMSVISENGFNTFNFDFKELEESCKIEVNIASFYSMQKNFRIDDECDSLL